MSVAGTMIAADSQAGSREGSRGAELIRLAFVTLQLGLLVLLIRQFQIENETFFKLIQLTFAGFVVHALLPMRFRLPFFALLSLTGIGIVFGLGGAVWLVGIGSGLIALGHLPVRFWIKVAVLLVAIIPLALLRVDIVPSPIPLAVWPILTSMFMFRLVIYLHDLRHSPPPFSLARTLAYFFMLPNITFPLFPVVDYKTFARSYYEVDAFRIYQRGLHWILRGVIHIILYRLVYHYVALDAAEVQTGAQLVQYIASAFLLYLRVSGTFHIAIGILHLFGFYLPETNHLYLLSSSFTDLWRRSNIYWKDAIMKLVYFPSFFRLRKGGNIRAITISMILVFFTTWAWHAVQWFWLRGEMLFTFQDISFYCMIGALVLWTALREAKQGTARVIGPGPAGWSFRRALGTVATIGTLMLLWSYWTADSLGQWFTTWRVAGIWTWSSALLVLAILAGYFVFAGWLWKPLDVNSLTRAGPYTPALFTVSVIGILLIGGRPSVYTTLGPEAESVMKLVSENRLNRRDEALLLRGYYEKVDSKNRLGGDPFTAERKPIRWDDLLTSSTWRLTNDFMQGELAPSSRMDLRGVPFSTNQWGMRDREYSLEKPEGTYRIAMLGGSDLMGLGVGDGESFENGLETRLNQERPGGYRQYEVLNFGVLKYTIWQHAHVLDTRVLRFKPDLVILVYHPNHDPRIASDRLSQSAAAGYPVPYPELADIVRRSGVVAPSDTAGAMRRMKPFGPEIIEWSLNRIAGLTRANNIPVVLLDLRLPDSRDIENAPELEIARRAGYIITRFTDYGPGDERRLKIDEWDRHPNAEGHGIIANGLYQELLQHRDSLRLGGSPASPAPPRQEEK
jgi:D-alanyl-lipoteichoic acid acyltransferase DltB (MBOAT superfamily)